MASQNSTGVGPILIGGLFLGLCVAASGAIGDAWDDFEALRTGKSQSQQQQRSVAVGGSSRPGSIERPADEDRTRRKAAELGFTLPSKADSHYEYRIGSHDVLEIEVFQVEELSKATRVNSSGYISVPLIGKVMVGGLTVGEAEQRIAEALAKDYLQDPQVSIFVKEYESQKFTVEGEVKEPGVFPIKGPTSLLQAIAMAIMHKNLTKPGFAFSLLFQAVLKGSWADDRPFHKAVANTVARG